MSAEPTITSYAEAPARTIRVGDVTYAYRELGPKGGIPVVLFVQLAATLDNWDPRIVDPIAANRHVITFDVRGVGASTGKVDRAWMNSHAWSAASSSLPDGPSSTDLVRKLVLTGTGPRGGKDMDKIVAVTYYDILRATPTRSDPKELLFFNRNATGKAAGTAFIKRLQERTVDRDKDISLTALRTPLKAIQRFGRSAPSDVSAFPQPTRGPASTYRW